MESSVSGSGNLTTNTENSNLNEATPAVDPVETSDLPKDSTGTLVHAVECDDAISSTTPDKFTEDFESNSNSLMNLDKPSMSNEPDADFFTSELSISDVPTEKITENVEDIVQDLENLLGESNDSYRYSRESFDSSKLADSYDEVNSSNVADLFTIEQPNLDAASILLDVGIEPSSNTECDQLETAIRNIPKLDVVQTPEDFDTVSKTNEQVEILNEPKVASTIQTPPEVSIAGDDNLVLESQIESEKFVAEQEFDTPSESTNEQIRIIQDEMNASAATLTEVEDTIDAASVSISNAYQEDTEISANIELPEIPKNLEVQQHDLVSVEEPTVPVVSEESVPNASELLDELINDSSNTNIEIGCIENLFDSANNEANADTIEECSKQEEIAEGLSDKVCSIEENNSVEPVCSRNDENEVVEEAAELLPSIVECALQATGEVDGIAEAASDLEDTSALDIAGNDIEETKELVTEQNPTVSTGLQEQMEVTESLALISEQCTSTALGEQTNITESLPLTDEQKIIYTDMGEQAKVVNSSVLIREQNITVSVYSDEQEQVPEVNPSIDLAKETSITTDEQKISSECSPELLEETATDFDESNAVIKSSQLVQPLTVEVEDSDCSVRQVAQKQVAEKDVPSKEAQLEKFEPQNATKQVVSVEADSNQACRAPLKMTITKNKSENVHSILKIYDPNDTESSEAQHVSKLVVKSVPTSTTGDAPEQGEEQAIPKITIKSVSSTTVTQHSPKITIKPIKSPEISDMQSSPKSAKSVVTGSGSPRITIKPVVKPESLSPLKLTLRPYPKLEEIPTSPKLNIKPIVKPDEPASSEAHYSPKITIKPIIKSPEKVESCPEEKHSPRITIKPVIKPPEESAKEEKQTYVEERPSPRITIKPILKPAESANDDFRSYPEGRDSPKITIKPIVRQPEEQVKQEEQRHSPRITIKPVIKPAEEVSVEAEKHSPRITIKPIMRPNEDHANQEVFNYPEEKHSPKVTIKPIKKPEELVKENAESSTDDRQNLRITIKPVIKQFEDSTKEESHSEEKYSPRITIKPIVKPSEESTSKEEGMVSEDRPSPRITIKPVIKPPEESFREEAQSYSEERHSPRITIKPIIKPDETAKQDMPAYSEEKHSPRITIKPVMKPAEAENENLHSPRITIKPIMKPQEDCQHMEEMSVTPVQPFKLNIKPIVKPPECGNSPKVTIKPVPKPSEPEDGAIELIDFEEQIKQERIVLKIAKNTKREKESDKLKKIKLKLSKERGMAHIVPSACESFKRSMTDVTERELKHFKQDLPSDLTISLVPNTATATNMTDITITRIDNSASSLKDAKQQMQEVPGSSSDGKGVLKRNEQPLSSFFPAEEIPDPLAEIPVFEITLQAAPPKPAPVMPAAVVPPTPRKRGRPRKVPLEVREEFKDPKEEETPPTPVVEESTRPKRSCRGASVKTTLGIKPRKPRAPSTRGRGGRKSSSGRGGGARKTKERKSTPVKFKIKDQLDYKEFDVKDAEFKQVPLPTESGNREVVIYEEETRMSAENSSRAQTPAKQVLTSSNEVVDESQSSVQSNTTTESGEKTQKVRKGPRLEVHQEPEGEVISADKLAEYSWGGGGPYMLQEQVAQFLGIKSFKRKYPGIQRRPVDMQERDFIRESCLASEAMCDMGLTAVRSEDILDIMYTDFQHKYEEYCKHQRDRQAKDVSNKQKALSLAASQEKNKLDIVEQAVQSAFQWNANFNKARREQRRACMDLQTFTVHFPKGKMKQVNKAPIGNYPLALVPGQFTDYYKKYSPFELGSLPLNTIGCKAVSLSNIHPDTEDSQSDGSGSDSDSSSSDSDSSDSSSGAEDCKMCTPTAHAAKKMLVH